MQVRLYSTAAAVVLMAAVMFICGGPLEAQNAAQSPGATLRAVSPTALYPGDIVRVAIWRPEGLSGDFLIDERGIAVIPLLGPQHVAGVEIGDLRTRLQGLYESHLESPSITITPLKRIFLVGEVANPGALYVDATVTLTSAVGMAGGRTPDGMDGRLTLVRASGEVIEVRLQDSATLPPLISGDEIHVPQRSWVARNASVLLSMGLSTVTSVVLTVLIANK